METENQKSTPVTQSQFCPFHHMGPLIYTHGDQLCIRFCCDFFTRKYISTIDGKLKGKVMVELINKWETDLLMNELQE